MCHARHHHPHPERRTPMDQPHMRVSDADRERAAETLRAHAGEGRLDAEELEERLGKAFAAKTRGELAALTRDLPGAGRRPERRDEAPPFIPLAILLVAIWAVTGAGYFWPIWPLMFFAFAGLAHVAKRGNTRVIR